MLSTISCTQTLTIYRSPQPKRNPFSLPSILTPDPSSSLAHSLVLHGRTLDVIRAVTRDVAGKLKQDNEKAREKADKRNMYLLREGGTFSFDFYF
jgi:nucleolar protein 4